jgi:hypothetical protein
VFQRYRRATVRAYVRGARERGTCETERENDIAARRLFHNIKYIYIFIVACDGQCFVDVPFVKVRETIKA